MASLVTSLLLMTYIALTQAACPHLASNLNRWSAASTWPGNAKPQRGSKVVITKPVLLDEAVPELSSITVNDGGSLVLSPALDHLLVLRFIEIHGEMHVGSEDCRFTSKVNITLIGQRGDATPHQDFGQKYIGVARGGTLELHGEDKLAWTKLTRTITKLTKTSGLHYQHKSGPNEVTWKRGVVVWVFSPQNGALLRHAYFQTAGQGQWDREHDPAKLVSYLDAVQDGEVVAIAVQHSLFEPHSVDVTAVYSAFERLLYGHETQASLVRSLHEYDAYVVITQKGHPENFVESVDRMTGTPEQHAFASLTLWPTKVKVTAESYVDNVHGYRNYADVKSMSTDFGFPTLHVLDDVSTWKPGDRVVLASTDYDWTQAEEGVVIPCATCDAHTLRLDLEAKFDHWGEMTNGVDMRGEVGLLTRNILIQGAMEDHCPAGNGNCNNFKYDTFGGHLKVVMGFKNVHIDGVEFYHMGQQTEKGFYPVHFHMCFDVDGVGNYTTPPYVRNNAIHNCFSRCVTVHGTHGLTVQDNVGYDTLGHCYFLEDGGEKRTVLDGNLGLSTRKGKILPSDDTPATFWLTNPLVYLRNNVAAGGDNGVGFWYIFPDEPHGPSRGLGFMHKDEARHTAYTEFNNNVAHSNVKAGLFADNKVLPNEAVGDNNGYSPYVNPLNTSSPYAPSNIHRLTAYKNGYQNVWVRGGWFSFDHMSLSDSTQGITMARGGGGEQYVSDSIIVGESSSEGEPSAIWDQVHSRTNYMPRSIPIPYDLHTPIQGFIFYDGPVYGKNIYFTGFSENENRTSSAIGFHRNNNFSSSTVSSLTNMHFGFVDGHPTGNRFYDGNETISGFAALDGDKMGSFRDADGSVSGVPGGVEVVKPDPYFVTAQCYVRENWKVGVCPYHYGALEVSTPKAAEKQSTDVIAVRDDEPTHPVSIMWDTANHLNMILGGTHSYTVHWTHNVPSLIELRLQGGELNQWVRVGICIPRDADFELYTYAPHYRPTRSEWLAVQNVAALDADTTGYAYYWDHTSGLLFFKFQNFNVREPNTTSDCPGTCAYVKITIKSGNLLDHDCRSRAYGPYKRAPVAATQALHSIALPATDNAPPRGWGAGATRPFQTRTKVDGGWGSWSQWSACSKPCGGGEEYRLRQCNSPRPLGGGQACQGQRVETRTCNTATCAAASAVLVG